MQIRRPLPIFHFLAIAPYRHEIKAWKWCLHLGSQGLRSWLVHCRNNQTICICINVQIRGSSLPVVRQWNDVFLAGEPCFGVPTQFFGHSCFSEGRWSSIWMMPPLSILSNMQIRRPLPKFHFLARPSSLKVWDKRIKSVSTPRFSGSLFLIMPLPKWSTICICINMQIRSQLAQNG